MANDPNSQEDITRDVDMLMGPSSTADKQVDSGNPALSAVSVTPGAQSDEDVLRNILPPVAPNKPQPKYQAEVVEFDLGKQLQSEYKVYADNIGDDLAIGDAGVHRSTAGALSMMGVMSYEDAEASLKNDEDRAKLAGERNDAFKASSQLHRIWSFTEPAIQAYPALKNMAVTWAAGAAGGATVGAGSGPGAIATGAMSGNAALFVSNGVTGAGDAYINLRRAGVNENPAKAWAFAAGAVNAYFGGLRFGNLGSSGIKMIAASQKETGWALAKNALSQYAKSVGFQFGAGTLQNMATNAFEAAAKMQANVMKETPSDIAMRFFKQEQDLIAQTALLDAAAKAGGATLGMAAKKLIKPSQTSEGALSQINQIANDPNKTTQEHLEAHATKMEQEAAAKAAAKQEPEAQAKEPLKATITKEEQARDEARTTLEGRVTASEKNVRSTEKELKQTRKDYKDARRQEAHFKLKELTKADAEYYRLKAEDSQKKRMELETALKLRKETHKDAVKAADKLEKKHHEIEHKRVEAKMKEATPKQFEEKHAGTQRLINKVKKYFNNQLEAQKTFDEYNQKIADKKYLSDEDHENYEAASLAMDYRRRSSVGMRNLLNDLKDIYVEGKANKIFKLEAELKARKALVQEVVKAIDPDNTIYKGPNLTAEPQKRAIGYAPGFLNFFGNYLGKWRYVMRKVTDAAQEGVIDKLGVRGILTDIDKAVMDDRAALMETAKEKTGMSGGQVNELIRKGVSTNPKDMIGVTAYETVMDEHGEPTSQTKPHTFRITINQAIDKVLQSRDTDAKRALVEGNGFFDEPEHDLLDYKSTVEEIEEQLALVNPNYLKLVDALQESYARKAPEVAKEFRKAYGVEMPVNDNYSGTITHEGQEVMQSGFELQIEEKAKSRRTATTPTPKAVKERTGSTSALAYEDAFTKYNRYSQQVNHWMGMREHSKNVLGPVYRSKAVADAVRNGKGGQVLWDSMKEDVNDILHGNSDKKAQWLDLLDKHIFQPSHMFMLGVKPLMIPKHLLSIGTAIQHLPSGTTAEHIANTVEFFGDANKNMDAMKATKEWQTRHGSEDLSTATSSKVPETQKHPALQAVDKFGMIATTETIKWADAAVLYSAKKIFEKRGMSPEKALAKGGEVLHNTQVSAAVDLTSNLTRSQIGAFVTKFQGQVTNLTTDTYIKWDRYFATKDPAHFQAAVKSSIVAGYSMAAFEGVNAAYHMAMAKDDRERENAIFEGVISVVGGMVPIINYPLIKDLRNAAVATAINSLGGEHLRVPESQNMVGQYAQNWIKEWGDITHAATDPQWADQHIMQLMIDANNTIGWKVGSPLKSPLDFINRLSK